MYNTERGKNHLVNFIQKTSIYDNTAAAFDHFCVLKPFQSIYFSKSGCLGWYPTPGSRHNNSVSVREILVALQVHLFKSLRRVVPVQSIETPRGEQWHLALEVRINYKAIWGSDCSTETNKPGCRGIFT